MLVRALPTTVTKSTGQDQKLQINNNPKSRQGHASEIQNLKFNEMGLIPAIVQDATSGQVLMLAWMNKESLRLTLEQGETWFWSRSRAELWHKGATSGNIQNVCEIYYDCDGDTLLVRVEATGPACHTGQTSCFFTELEWAKGEVKCQ
jgi:phosphoribosyl-ATP pyrophosphohydrolase/phosphoribosyl-AMP cyclohydrolase